MNNQKQVITITAILFAAVFTMLPLKAMASGYDSDMEGKRSGTMMDNKNMHGQYALDGYCPVAIHKGMYLKGNDRFVTEYKGKVYKFVKFEAQKAFLENPEMFLQDVEKKYHQLKMKNKGSMPKGSY